jgi:hypothetical protein
VERSREENWEMQVERSCVDGAEGFEERLRDCALYQLHEGEKEKVGEIDRWRKGEVR